MEKIEEAITDEERARQARVAARPLLSGILNLHDFEVCGLGFEQMVSFLTPSRLLLGWSCRRKHGHIILQRPMMRLPTAKTTLLSTGKLVRMVNVSFSDTPHSVWFRPRILRDVTNVDWSTTILGHKTSMPLYIVRVIFGRGSVLLTSHT